MGLRFRKHYSPLPGTPDVAFPRARLAVFLDGDFWHGRGFETWKGKLPEFWLKKITRNRERDSADRDRIREMGWSVLRLWERDVKGDLAGSLSRIADSLLAASEAAGVPVPAGAAPDRAVPQTSWKEGARAAARALDRLRRKPSGKAGARSDGGKGRTLASKTVAFRPSGDAGAGAIPETRDTEAPEAPAGAIPETPETTVDAPAGAIPETAASAVPEGGERTSP
jgi:DNA mismatch endonuclease (patch repair protein)